jgi:G3E family GTPase
MRTAVGLERTRKTCKNRGIWKPENWYISAQEKRINAILTITLYSFFSCQILRQHSQIRQNQLLRNAWKWKGHGNHHHHHHHHHYGFNVRFSMPARMLAQIFHTEYGLDGSPHNCEEVWSKILRSRHKYTQSITVPSILAVLFVPMVNRD